MIDTKELRRRALDGDLAAMQEIILRLAAAESECLEQARLNGMGSEREAALMAKLEAAEKERDECNRRRLEAADHFAAQTALMKKKYDDLRAKIAEMEQQAPVMWANSSNINSSRINKERGGSGDQHTCSETQTAYHHAPLYALPGAKGE